MVGKIDTEFKAANVRIDSVGLNFIIAHLSVGSIQIALGRPITVVRPRGMYISSHMIGTLES